MIVAVKLSEWAKANGVSRQSACRWFHAGMLPVPARQLTTGTILVDEPPAGRAGVALYARVSSGDQRGDLDRQVARLAGHTASMGVVVSKVVPRRGRSVCLQLEPGPGELEPGQGRGGSVVGRKPQGVLLLGARRAGPGPRCVVEVGPGARKGRRVGFPRFKARHARRSFRVTTGSFGVVDDRHVRLTRIGVIRTKEPTIKLGALLDADAGRVLSATVSESAGRWYVSFGCEAERPERQPPPGPPIGDANAAANLASLVESLTSTGTASGTGTSTLLRRGSRGTRPSPPPGNRWLRSPSSSGSVRQISER
ncbi:MAG: IS607 family transposase [Acidimicrobiales bacterium]